MGDGVEKEGSEETTKSDADDEQPEESEGFTEMGDRNSMESANLVTVESKTVNYVIMNPDFYKEAKTREGITGTCSAYEYVTRKPRG